MKKDDLNTSLNKKAGMKILLVEDNPINQIIVSEMLLQLSVIITTAGNGLEAIELLEKNSFDVVLMDIQMPKLGGIETTEIIREKLKDDTPVIAMTAHATREEREKCYKAGMNEFLSKPIEREYLFSLLDKYYCSDREQIQKIKKTEVSELINVIQLDGVDIADAVERLNCDYQVFDEILENFGMFYLNIAGKLRNLIDSGKITELKREAHSLKGAAINVSAVKLYLATKEFEDALKIGNESLYNNLIDKIDLEFERIVKSRRLLKNHIRKELSRF